MNVGKTTADLKPVPFNELQMYYRNTLNRMRGITGHMIPNRIEFPPACHSKNKFKTK